MTTEMTPGVIWTGVVDWSVRMFHSYAVPDGVTYNSYLIKDEHLTLVDTVKNHFEAEFIHKLQQIADIKKIEYLISLHAEPDHAGCVASIYNLNPNVTIVCSVPAKEILILYNPGLAKAKFMTVTNDSTLKIGKNELKFRMTQMQHWPESMGCYMGDILFSSDFFGQHLASTERYVDDFDIFRVIMRMEDYVANIMNPFRANVAKTVAFYQQLPINFIFPAHGLCFKHDNCKVALEVYQKFVDQTIKVKKIVILFSSMYGSTAKVSQIIAQGVLSAGYEPVLLNADTVEKAEISYQLFKSKAVLIGSATLNNQMMPNIDGAINYAGTLRIINGLKFGVYGGAGWSNTGVEQIVGRMNEFGAENVGTCSWILAADEQVMQQAFELGRKVALSVE
ncbi:A-type_flavoprotein 6 [Hexamita inflata]|uniref:A-type_flavoprotein 6 n=1 Tax=Hexamita inflata TaxID=28002 RepID=A0ABP1H8L3_9EUKA